MEIVASTMCVEMSRTGYEEAPTKFKMGTILNHCEVNYDKTKYVFQINEI